MLAGVLALLMGSGGVAASVLGVVATIVVSAGVAAGAARFIMRDQASLEVAFPAAAAPPSREAS